MAEELEGVETPTGGPPAGSSAPITPQYDPEYIARLQSYYEQTSQFLQTIEPIYDDIKPLIEDEGQRQLYKRAREAYTKSQEEQKPKLSAEGQAILDELMPYVKKPAEYVDILEKQRVAEQQRQAKEFQDANLAYGQKLLQDAALGSTQQDRLNRIQRIANFGASNGLTLEQAHKELYGDLTPPPPVHEEPVTSRAGVPKDKTPQRDPSEPIDVFGLVRDRVAAAQKSRAS